MNTHDVEHALQGLGWETFTDEVGDKYVQFALLDRIVQIIYGVREYGSGQQLDAMLSLSTTDFSSNCMTIDPGGGNYTPLVRSQSGIRLRASEITEKHVRQASTEAITWAKKQDLDQAIKDHAALPTTAPGARPIWHLGALAALRNSERLKFYQASFEAGDRLGFVNYITQDHIDRALSLIE